ncbi:methyltransferase domain-containing protein [Aeromicrobium sp. 179-A 4D2 NHS]|uniref:methyltransferase domain-containing protein n=1 Tax=Aeromicrobium sp. 179-A 4D2 NHS TaxID=3142375 RepID=UPI0039A0ADA7
MLTATQDDVYFERMASSLGDKARLLHLTHGSRVLDVGAGGGEFAELERINGKQVTAVDGSWVALDHIRENFPLVDRVHEYAHSLHYEFKEDEFDTVVCSALMHEVYSYGTEASPPYSLHAVDEVLESIWTVTKTEGTLLIRDGVMPREWDKPVRIETAPGATSDVLAFFLWYAQQAPFFNTSGDPRTVHLRIGDDGRSLEGNLASAMEFLYTYTWGWEPSERETRELYGILTLDDWIDLLDNHGFTTRYSTEYVQPGYVEYLSTRVRIVDEQGAPVQWPSTNMILSAWKR